MLFRPAIQQVTYSKPAAQAFEDVRSALTLIGKVTGADAATHVVEGHTYYGAQKVRMKITIVDDGPQSTVTVRSRGDDIWGVAARYSNRLLLQGLGVADQAGGPVAPATPRPQPFRDLESKLTVPQKVAATVFIGFAGLAGLEVAWWRLVGMSLEVGCGIAAALGLVTFVLWAKRRYAAGAALGGAVAGLSSVWFTVYVLQQSDTTYKLVLAFTVLLGMLPGVALLLAWRWVQDRLLPPPTDDSPTITS